MLQLLFSQIPKKTYNVSESQTAQLADYESWDVVWFHHGSIQLDYDESDPRRRQIYNYDWETIAQKALLAGNVSAACTHAIDQIGYRFFNSGNEIKSYTDGSSYPLYNNYKISNSILQGLGITNDHLNRFVSAYKKRGMKVGIYYNQAQAANLIKYPSPSGIGITNWYDYLIRELLWLKSFYNLDFIWVDHPYLIELSDEQRNNIYQYSRNYNAGLVMQNAFGDITKFRFPSDIKFTERPQATTPGSFYNSTVNHDEVDYYIPSGIATSGLYRIEEDETTETLMWGPANETTYPPSLIEYNLVRDQNYFDTYYTEAKDNSLPFFINMPIVQNDLISDYYTRVSNLSIL